MKKILSLLMISILIISGTSIIALAENGEIEKKEKISFSEPSLQEVGEYLSINIKNTAFTREPGAPLLPVYKKIFTLPYDVKILSISYKISNVKQKTLSKPIIPAPQPLPLISVKTSVKRTLKNKAVYNSEKLYPDKWFDYTIGCGLNNGKHTLFVVTKTYPIRYSPLNNTIYYIDDATITIKFKKNSKKTFSPNESNLFDLLIIAPEKFSDELQPLIQHKIDHGIKTMFASTENIYKSTDGRDKPEKIKHFIKDAIEDLGIKYVLLVGGLKSLIHAKRRDNPNEGTQDWYVPVRYTNLYDSGGIYDPGFISDLYYADIYKYDEKTGEWVFDDWDSNGNSIFAEWKAMGKDTLDLYPDVYIGRLPCRNENEVKLMVKEIIKYENGGVDDNWFKKMVVVGSDTFDDTGSTDYYEGEVQNQKALDYMTGFQPIKIWGSNINNGGPVPEPQDIINAINQGCGFLYFAGHGSPSRWNTYYPEKFNEPRAGGLWIYHMPFISNKEKTPICIVGGCHNSQFNVTATSFLNYWLYHKGWTYIPTPECWSWWLTRDLGGGSIATIGNTGLGYGAVGNHGDLNGDGIDEPDCVETLSGYIESLFFREYGQNNVHILGETWGGAVTSYLNTFPGMDDQLDCKTVEEWVLLGDPSLMIGGYK